MATRIWEGTVDGDYSDVLNWFADTAPGAGDHVRIPAGSGNIDGGDYSATAIGDFVVEPGYTGTIGSAATYLKVDPDLFQFSGLGLSYLNLHTAAISGQVFTSGPAGLGFRGLNLLGSGLVTLNVMGGSVGIASLAGETATVATVRVVGQAADVWVGKGTTLTTFYQTGGKSEVRCAATTITVYGGTLYTKDIGAVTTLNIRGGTVYLESTGTVTTLNADSGDTNFLTSGASRTVTTLKQNPGASVSYDPAVLTVTNRSAPDFPIRIDSSEP